MFFLLHIHVCILSNVLSFYLCVTCLKQCWCRNKIYYSILFIYYLLDNSWISYMCLYHLQDKTKNLKRVYSIQTNKKQIQGYQRDDMLTKTRNYTTTEYTLMHNKYIITYECHDNAPRMWKVVQLEKYFDFSLYSHHFSLLSLASLLSAPEREVTSPSDFKVVGAWWNSVWSTFR